MKIPFKFTKKSVFIILMVVGGIAFIGTLIFLYFNFSYQWNHIKNNVEDTSKVDETTDQANTDADTNTEDDASLIRGGYSSSINCDGTGYDITLIPNKIPKIVAAISIFKNSDKANHVYDFDKDSIHYAVGTLSGQINGVTIPKDTKYYIAFYKSLVIGAYEGWGDNLIRYFVLNNKTYILSSNGMITKDDNYFGGETYDIDSTQESGVLESNVEVLVPSEDYGSQRECVNDSTYKQMYAIYASDGGLNFQDYFFLSDTHAKFKLFTYKYKTLDQVSGYTQVDAYEGLKILRNDAGNFIIEDREGFVENLQLVTEWVENGLEFPVKWSNGTETTTAYSSTLGTCEASKAEIPVDYVYEDVSINDLNLVGTSYGGNVYEKKSIATDTFTKKLYDEDYLLAENWKYNTITSDDTAPLDYQKYLTLHPVIYIADPYGKFIRLTNNDFFMVGGCAKPAIYLYPSKPTDISVKVIPNGKLTFTYPKYVNGWNVMANSNGDLVNKADGKTYNYLWWDSYTYDLTLPNGGFVVKKSEAKEFLNQKLEEMNLNEREIAEFKAYWVPKIQNEDTPYIYISFLFNDSVNQIAMLNVIPMPENIFRVFMVYKPVLEYFDVNPLVIQKANRLGYTLVEWGGAKL